MTFDIKTLWRRLTPFTRYRVLFIPVGGNDPIRVIFDSLYSSGHSSPECVLVEKKPDNLVDIAPELEENGESECLVIFAHPSVRFSGFAVNAKSGHQEDVLPLPWWEGPSRRFPHYCFRKTMAHVCYGQKILANPAWRLTFPAWVSYRGDVHAFLYKKNDRVLWAGVVKAIVNAALESRLIGDLKNQIVSIYERRMSEISDANNPHWVLHAIHFQKAINELTSSEEM